MRCTLCRVDALPNAHLIGRFYEAFARRDAAAMNACYRDDVRFSDPAFGVLEGEDARAMWTLLCARGKDLRIELGDVRADDEGGSAHWEAWYTFAATGRKVHNIVEARFTVADGLIVRHDDAFDFGRWARQALGVPSVVARTPFFRNAFQRKARAMLQR